MKINEIWTELENDTTLAQGLLYRRYSGTILPDVFIAIKNPEKYRAIAASVSSDIIVNIDSFSNLKDISIEIIPGNERANKNTIVFKLINSQHSDIFSALCEDLMLSIINQTNEKQLVKQLLNRFEKWKSLFDKASMEGLSPAEQRGLWGELYFLRKFLLLNKDVRNVVNSWLGPEKQVRDFQHGNWAVEIKTTHGNNHQKVCISSERQLDSSNIDILYLHHISLDIRNESGESLNEIVESLYSILKDDYQVLYQLKNKLMIGGYFDHHKHLYKDVGYFIREEAFYKVEGAFPRIEEADLRLGVGDVDYSIILSQCSSFIKQEKEIFSNIIFNE
jgi:hypothetical protein